LQLCDASPYEFVMASAYDFVMKNAEKL